VTVAVVFAALAPLAPATCALLGFLLPQQSRRVAGLIGVVGAAAALVSSIALAIRTTGGRVIDASTIWVTVGSFRPTLSVRVDTAAALVAIAVAVVALAVQVYSISYLHDDRRYGPYAAQVSLFTAAMMTVVVSGDLIMLLVGWEVMGICSYLLIGHDRRLPEAPAAAVKAFVVTRAGDVGFLLAIALIGVHTGTFRIADALARAPHALGSTGVTVVCLLLLAGVAGKSAQFPLHTWLPDAMAGPTPISALIHAATMVAAGVYVVGRLYHGLFDQSPTALATLAVMAAVTMLIGGFAATAQDDIKRVLAWSTVSQIAYMAGALAVGSPAAALFHLLTHAAFKALLFLAAGCVIHAVGTNLMSSMGGLRRSLPVTFWSMTIGLAALAGVPPLAGFWSKESVLDAAARATTGDGQTPTWAAWVVLIAGLTTVALTGWYATRLCLRTFFGPARLPEDAHPHEAPALMRWPVMLLVIPTVGVGLFALSDRFARALDGPGSTREAFHIGDGWTWLSLALLAVGVLTAWAIWRGAPASDPARALGPLLPLFANAFYLDTVQNVLLVRPTYALARAVRRGDENVVDGTVEGVGRRTTGLGSVLTRVHEAGLPRAATAVLGGALVAAVLAAIGGLR
jgi:NADH-quinone oxidoreductase subunit L